MKKLLLTTVAVLCFAMPATAQEYGRRVPAQQNSSSYGTVRMGGGRFNMKMNNGKENESLFLLSGAIGTEIAPDVRAELEITGSGYYEETLRTITDSLEYKRSVVNISANILKDFNVGQVKPYIGAGVGVAFFSDEIKYDIIGVFVHSRGTKKESNAVLSGNVQAGFAVALSNTVSVDANVRYSHFGNYTFKFLNNDIKMENHSVDLTVGLRFAF